MASIKELVDLNDGGDLGALLVRTFGGTLSQFSKCKDSEFKVMFGQENGIPSHADIYRAVVPHYTDLGYIVDARISKSYFEASIFSPSGDGGSLRVVIVTNCPSGFGDETRHVRVTTNWV